MFQTWETNSFQTEYSILSSNLKIQIFKIGNVLSYSPALVHAVPRVSTCAHPCICACTPTHTGVYARAHAYTCVRVRTCARVCTHARTQSHTRTRVRTPARRPVRTCARSRARVIYIYIYTYIIYLFILIIKSLFHLLYS